MIVNGIIISNDKNKIEKKIIKASGLSNVKKAGIKSVRGADLKILK